MKIITTTGSFTGYSEFNDSNEDLEEAKVYLAKQIARNGSKNWSIIRCDRTTSETLFSSSMVNDRKLMDQLVTIESRKQIELAVRDLC